MHSQERGDFAESDTHTHKHTHTRYTKPGVGGSADIKANNRLPTVLILPISYFNTYKCCCRFSILLLPFHRKRLMRRVSPFAAAYWLFAHSTANSSHNKWNAVAVHIICHGAPRSDDDVKTFAVPTAAHTSWSETLSLYCDGLFSQ